MSDPIEKARAHFMETLGNVPEPIRAFMDHAPGYLEGYLKMREYIYTAPPKAALDLKTKELIYVLLDIVTRNLEGAENHLRAAMRHGLTSAELAEACMQVIHVCGITPWGTVGWKVCDTAARIEREAKTKGAASGPKRRKGAAKVGVKAGSTGKGKLAKAKSARPASVG
jgi:alkylhydroperoxidase/carboxymuconolactone decarboxylase family protein YurZ